MASVQELLAETSARMQRSVDALARELNSIRTGRASPALVENIEVEYYGVPTPLNQVASISVPEARLLLIQPWDKQSLADLEKGIHKSELGLVPNNDGTVIRINIPPLTEERRRDLVRLLGKKVEDAHVSVRNVRRDSLQTLRSMEKDASLSKDEGRRAQEQLQKVTDAYIVDLDSVRKQKEAEVMEV
jgi:ribosome recycling factor